MIHAACFAVGAVVGGGSVALASLSKKAEPRTTPVPSSSSLPIPKAPVTAPVMQVVQGGQLDLSAPPAAGSILKYGHPGEMLVSP